MLTLGLDVGSQSVGWALVESDDDAARGRIVASGVRVFPEGVERDQQGGEKSKSQTRRTARGMRRQIARRRTRRAELRRVLAEHGLLPAEPSALDALLQVNPYPLRAGALTRKLEPHEIGRVLYHLAERRGFLSNRKTDRAKADRGMLAEISALQARIDASGCGTLGEYLNTIDSAFAHSSRPPEPTEKQRKEGELPDTVRRVHTRREMYIQEFETIWEEQARHHPSLLTPALRRLLYQPDLTDGEGKRWVCKGLIFGQRRMYWPKEAVGRCELEPKRKRCIIGERCAQRFRILQEVNNLKVIDRATGEERRLSPEERSTLIGYLSDAKERTFDQIRKKLGLAAHVRFNLEGPDRAKLKGHITDAMLAKHIGKRAWSGLDERVKDTIASIVLEEEREAEGLSSLMLLGLTAEQAQAALGAHLPDGRAAYCREVIERLLPHLEAGKHLMGNTVEDSALHAAGFLRPDERAVGTRRFLPPAPDLPNPLVRQAMVEVRKVVNAVLRELCDAPPERGGLGGRRPDAIHIELAREAKKSLQERMRMRFDNAKRQRSRDDAADRIRELGHRPTRETIDKYLLWREQGELCAYSCRRIGVAQLLSAETDIDHILPRWRSLDNSMMNKVVAFREENHAKGQRTPHEWLPEAHPEKWEAVLAAASKLPYPKFRRFIMAEVTIDDFVNRQFQDTAYISRAVMQYLKCLGTTIVTPRGGMTAQLRRSWGLDGILSEDGVKTRDDHRHHAVDAAVIALTTRKRLHALANDRGENVTPPWPSVRHDLEQVVAAMNVSHRALRRLRGALHEGTIYGATQKCSGEHGALALGSGERPHAKGWVEDGGVFVRRKPISEIKDLKHLSKVRDRGVRLILKRHLDSLGVDASKASGALPKKCFEGEHEPRMPSGVPIRRVRMIERSKTFRPVRPGQYVKPGSNHHIVYRARRRGEVEAWLGEVVPMWDAALRSRRDGLAMVDRADNGKGRFLFSLSIGEMFEMDNGGGDRLLCVVQVLDQDRGRLNYKLHTDARKADEIKKANQRLTVGAMQKRNARKVLIDPIGRIRRAND